MKLIIGLGNPEKKYEKTHHNAGFIAVDFLIDKYGFVNKKMEQNAITYSAIINDEKVIFAKPQTYMNNSGYSVVGLINYYKLNFDDILIIYDDKDFPVGKNQFRLQGGAGGHNGVKSIIEQLNTNSFKRLRLGIGSPPFVSDSKSIVSWVLNNFNRQDFIIFSDSFIKISNFINEWIESKDFNKVMNKYNSSK